MRDTRRCEEKRENPQNVEMTTRGLMFKDLLMLRSMKVIKFRDCEDAIEVAQAVSTLSQSLHDNQNLRDNQIDHVREEDEIQAKKERVKEKSPVLKHPPNCPRHSKSHRESKRKKQSKEGSFPPKTVILPTQSPPKAPRKHRSSRRKRNEERSANQERGDQRRQKSLPVATGSSVGGGKLRRNMTTAAGEEGTSRVR